jgi:hypothetical protein
MFGLFVEVSFNCCFRIFSDGAGKVTITQKILRPFQLKFFAQPSTYSSFQFAATGGDTFFWQQTYDAEKVGFIACALEHSNAIGSDQ